jgi:hypothetical protein
MASDSNKSNKKSEKLALSSEVLQGLFENGKSVLSAQFIRWKLWKKWAEYVGPTISAVSEPVGYKRGILYLWVKNASWMQQMIFMIEPLKENINSKLGMKYIRGIHLTLDRHAVPGDEAQKQELAESMQSLMKQGEES